VAGPRLFRSYYRRRAVFYRGVETPQFVKKSKQLTQSR
jgi:hypothetical protein